MWSNRGNFGLLIFLFFLLWQNKCIKSGWISSKLAESRRKERLWFERCVLWLRKARKSARTWYNRARHFLASPSLHFILCPKGKHENEATGKKIRDREQSLDSLWNALTRGYILNGFFYSRNQSPKLIPSNKRGLWIVHSSFMFHCFNASVQLLCIPAFPWSAQFFTIITPTYWQYCGIKL